MNRNIKADLRGIGSKEKHLTGKSKRLLNSHNSYFRVWFNARIAALNICDSQLKKTASDASNGRNM
jgi:hypothetical protein